LDIDNHSFDSTSSYSQLLLEDIAGDGKAVPQQYFIGRTAYSRQVDSCGPFFSGQVDEFFIPGGHDQHFREDGLMSVDDDIDF